VTKPIQIDGALRTLTVGFAHSFLVLEQPVGTVTLLFTDIEGSTRLLDRLGPERYRSSLELHRRLLRDAFAQHGGYEVDHEGDAFFVAFSSAREAVAAAADAQRALASADWTCDLQVRVRMGIHTGEPLPAPPKYIGLDVHKAARVMAAAHGGQVVVTAATQELLPEGLDLLDLGEHRLKDLADAETLYQVAIPGLRSEFPPLKSLDHRPNNLPSIATPFIGRTAVLAEISEHLLRADMRLLTLTGPGGIGKTRLALQAAAETIEAYPDGVFWVPLAAITTSALVPAAVAHSFGIRDEPAEPVDKALQRYLGEKQLLLLLDNFEHLTDAAADIAALLAAAPRVRILVTSRAPLRVRGEHVYELPSLDTANAGAQGLSDAVELFVARAVAADRTFVLGDDNRADVLEIVRRLDGLPLAIELAAARIRTLPPRTLVGRLDRKLNLLTRGDRDADERQRTLHGTIQWSYDLLRLPEQRLLRRLAVFVGGFRLESAEAVLDRTQDLGIDVIDGLEALVENSLLKTRSDYDGEVRFWMLETIRDFAVEALSADPLMSEVRAAHAGYFLGVVEYARARLRTGAQGDILQALDADTPNLHAAFDWLLRHDDSDALVRFAGATWWMFWIRGRMHDAERWLGVALTRSAPPALLVHVLRGAAGIAHWRGDYQREVVMADRALSLAERQDDEGLWIEAALVAGRAAYSAGDYERAEAVLTTTLERARAHDDRFSIAMTLGNLATLARTLEDLPRAAALWHEALPITRELRDAYGTAICLLGIAFTMIENDDAAAAAELLEEAFLLISAIDYGEGYGYFLEGAAGVAAATGDGDAAIAYLDALETLHKDLGFHPNADDVRLIARTRERAAKLLPEATEVATTSTPEQGLDVVLAEARRTVRQAIQEHRHRTW
jgi:predicted ATPase/class 3 adenylate cyclase/tetratricopeptide (TPR) repeat protein